MAALTLLVPTAMMELAAHPRVRTSTTVSPAPWAIVFGAGLAPGGEPSAVLAERLDTALGLWRSGRVERLLLTGNSDPHHDEIRSMRRYLAKSGVPDAAVSADLDGVSTFDSCWRARSVYGVKNAILVTQRFHLARALWLARAAGMEAVGVPAGIRTRWTAPYLWRELLARPLAMVDVWTHARPRLPAATPLAG